MDEKNKTQETLIMKIGKMLEEMGCPEVHKTGSVIIPAPRRRNLSANKDEK